MNKLHVKTGDTVVIISGNDKGERGKVLEVSPKEKKIIVEGLNIATKHVKPRQMGQQGGIVKCEAPMYASKVMIVCPHCGKPVNPKDEDMLIAIPFPRPAASRQGSVIRSRLTEPRRESARTQTAAKHIKERRN